MVISVSREAAGLDVDLEIQSGGDSGGTPNLVAVADWPPITMGVQSTSGWVRIFQNPGTRILVRESARPIATQQLPGFPGQAESPSRRNLSIREISAALLVQSLLSTSIFEDPPPAGPLALIGNSCAFLQSVRIIGLNTDDSFFFVPPSSGIVYVDRWKRTWNWVTRESARQGEGGSPAENVLSNICAGVVHLWYNGQSIGDMEPGVALRAAFDQASRLYVDLTGTVGPEDQWKWNPALAYCEWYESLLPSSFHEALLTSDTLNWLIETWQAALSSGSRAEATKRKLQDEFRRRLEVDASGNKAPHRSKVWMYGYRTLIGNIDPELSILLKEYEKEYVERGGRGSKGRDAVEESVSIVESTNRYRFASHKTVESIADEELLRRVLAQLRP